MILLNKTHLTAMALDASEREGIGAYYAAKISLNQTIMHIEGRDVELTPGMNATVEIKTGTRRIIDYIISPLLRYKDEAAREMITIKAVTKLKPSIKSVMN